MVKENNLFVRGTPSAEFLVFFGFATSGIVLSTIRQASDLDYHCTVISDASFDRDPEVHRVLTEKVFPRQGGVVASVRAGWRPRSRRSSPRASYRAWPVVSSRPSRS